MIWVIPFQTVLIVGLITLNLENAKKNFPKPEILFFNTGTQRNELTLFMNGQDVIQVVIHTFL